MGRFDLPGRRRRFVLALLVVALIVPAIPGTASAAHVADWHLAGASQIGKNCADLDNNFAHPGVVWLEAKIDSMPTDGVYVFGVGSVTISNATTTSFDWTSTFDVDAVVVKSGSVGSSLYVYDGYQSTISLATYPTGGVWVGPFNNVFGDTGLQTPNGQQDISHVSFCYEAQEQPGELCVEKFYDANANGLNDDNQPIAGWEVTIQPGNLVFLTPFCVALAAGNYTVTESTPIELNWIATTPTSVNVVVPAVGQADAEFGNLCLGGGGGRTLGFWSNKNGAALVGPADLALLVALNLRNADGSHFDPATYADFRTWLLSANATNMANMLSAQMAAMQLNVFNGFVSAASLIYAPGTTSANILGFATVGAVLAEADAELGLNGLTTASSPFRSYQEALKNALDDANNNQTFVQPTPCAFTFP